MHYYFFLFFLIEEVEEVEEEEKVGEIFAVETSAFLLGQNIRVIDSHELLAEFPFWDEELIGVDV